MFGALQEQGIVVVLFVGWGIAGVYGTYALWMVAFGFRSPIIFTGLLAGLLALTPVLLTRVVRLPLWDSEDGIGRGTVLAISTLIILVGWLARLSFVIWQTNRQEPSAPQLDT